MKLTIPTPISPRQNLDAEGMTYWQTWEATPLFGDLRTFGNQREHVQKTLVTSATGVATTIYTEDLPFSAAWSVDAHVVGRATAGGPARARYVLSGLFYREAGGVAIQEGATTVVVSIESVAAFNATLSASGNGILVQVQDDGVRTMSWNTIVIVHEVT